jgi:membrane-bound lytic murein transglycosylase MltF
MPHDADLPPDARPGIGTLYAGDLDGMLRRRVIRVGVTCNRTHYFIDNGVQRGLTYEYTKLFEERLNSVLHTGDLRIHVVCIPMPRDQMLQALIAGRLDLAEGQFTITPERQAVVDFGPPHHRGADEIPVTAAGVAAVPSVDDLSGRDVFVRRSSSYYQSLLTLNRRLVAAGRLPAAIREVPESLDDDDLLEMVDAGLLSTIVVDDYLAAFWQRVLPRITLHRHAALRSNGELAVAFRKRSPRLREGLEHFNQRWGHGTAFGTIVRQKYLESTRYAGSATAAAERGRFAAVLTFFRSFGKEYDLAYLLMAAQACQASQLDLVVRRPVGAIGITRIIPATAAELNVADAGLIEANIHAGARFITQLMTTYFAHEPMSDLDRTLFAFAAYDAGPGRIRQLRRDTLRRGLNPNKWFGQVEQLVSARIGQQTVSYVRRILKYYVAFRLIEQEEAHRERERASLATPST